jgi:hypothetical protein
MKWFDKWFYRKARWCWHRAGQQYPGLAAEQDRLDEISKRGDREKCYPTEVPVLGRDGDYNGVNMDNSIRFNVLNCRGGVVLEVRVYDKKTHDNQTKTYLIPEGEPVAERIGQYVTMEMMQK